MPPVIRLIDDATRAQAISWIKRSGCGVTVTFGKPKTRSSEQNARLWACLTDISRQAEWHGQKLSADDWKLIFMDALGQELRAVPNMDGRGFVNLGRSSSRLSVSEMADLLTLIQAYADQNDIELRDSAPTPSNER